MVCWLALLPHSKESPSCKPPWEISICACFLCGFFFLLNFSVHWGSLRILPHLFFFQTPLQSVLHYKEVTKDAVLHQCSVKSKNSKYVERMMYTLKTQKYAGSVHHNRQQTEQQQPTVKWCKRSWWFRRNWKRKALKMHPCLFKPFIDWTNLSPLFHLCNHLVLFLFASFVNHSGCVASFSSSVLLLQPLHLWHWSFLKYQTIID